MPQTNAAAHPFGGYAGLVSVALCPVVDSKFFTMGGGVQNLSFGKFLGLSDLAEAGTSRDAPWNIGIAIINTHICKLPANHIGFV